MEETTVYADLTFLVNFSLDFLILLVSARLCSIKIKWKRLLLASVIGGLYGTGIIIVSWGWWYNFPSKMMVSALLVYIGLRPLNKQEFVKGLISFYLLSFVTAGAVMGFAQKGGGDQSGYAWYWLGSGMLVLIFIGWGAQRYLMPKLIPYLLHYQVQMNFDGQCCEGSGFLDTGNSLRDPLTGKPVVVAEYDLLKKCLPADLQPLAANPEDERMLLEVMENSIWSNRLRMIPYSSVGKKRGLMLGVRADTVFIQQQDRNMKNENVVIAICFHKLSSDGSFRMLIPATFVEEIGGKNERNDKMATV